MEIEECLSLWRSAEKEWVRSVECIIRVLVGIEKLPSQAEECGMGVWSAEWDRGALIEEELTAQ